MPIVAVRYLLLSYYEVLNKYDEFLSDSCSFNLPVKHLKIIDSTTISLFSDILMGVGRNSINGSTISKSSTFINGAIGFEVAVVIGEEVNGFITAERAREVVSGIAPAFEFADIGFQGNMEDVSFLDVIAMNTGGRLFIMGETTSLADLDAQGIDPDEISVTGNFNDEQFLETRTGVAVGGLFDAISFLSGELGARGISLQPGDVVFSGGLVGDQDEGFGTYIGDYGPLGTIEFTLTE